MMLWRETQEWDIKKIPRDFPDDSHKELVRHVLGR